MTTTQSPEPSPSKKPSTPAAAPSPVEKPGPLRAFIDSFAALATVKRSFWVCLLVFMLDGAAYFGIYILLTTFLHERVGLSDEWSSRYFSIFLAGPVTLFAAFFGATVDRLGVRRSATMTIIVGLGGRALLALCPALPATPVFAALALLMCAYSAGLLQSALYAGVKQSTDEKSSALGFSMLYAAMNGGVAAVEFASPYVRESFGLDGVIWMCAGITVAYLGMHLVIFPKSEGNPVPSTDAKPSLFSDVRGMMDPRFLFFIFILLPVRTLFVHQSLTLPPYILRAYAADVAARMEHLNMINPAIILFGTPIVAALTSRVPVVKMMIAGTLVSAASSLLLVPGPDLTMLIAYQVLFSIGEALWSSRFYEYVAGIAPPDKVGVYMGWANIPWFLAKFTTGLYSGWFLAQYCPKEGPQDTGTLWLVYTVIGLISPIGLILATKWLRAGDKPATATA